MTKYRRARPLHPLPKIKPVNITHLSLRRNAQKYESVESVDEARVGDFEVFILLNSFDGDLQCDRRVKFVLIYFFGLFGEKKMLLRELADFMNISATRVGQLKDKGLQRCREGFRRHLVQMLKDGKFKRAIRK